MALLADESPDSALFHYDYERNKDAGYPEAHLQLCCEPAGWPDLCSRTRGDERPFDRLHLPVGGRRYRPALEDLVEFLIAEKIAEARDGALTVINESRERFMEKQLRAAIRRRPEVALDVLREHAPELLA
jgi:hypothetical protein